MYTYLKLKKQLFLSSTAPLRLSATFSPSAPSHLYTHASSALQLQNRSIRYSYIYSLPRAHNEVKPLSLLPARTRALALATPPFPPCCAKIRRLRDNRAQAQCILTSLSSCVKNSIARATSCVLYLYIVKDFRRDVARAYVYVCTIYMCVYKLVVVGGFGGESSWV